MHENLKAIRRDILKSCYQGGGHIGGSFSIVEVLYVLYSDFLKADQDDFILSKGHAVPALYAILKHFGILSQEKYDSYGRSGTHLIQHPSILVPGIKYSSGALGNGLSVAAGMALSNKLANNTSNVFVLLGDGELNEGSTWEGFSYIGSKQLSSVIAFLDKNNLQASDKTKKFLKTDKLIRAVRSLGWKMVSVDGHNVNEIKRTTTQAIQFNKPCLIVLNTIKGKGVSYMENNVSWHHRKPTKEEYEIGIKELT